MNTAVTLLLLGSGVFLATWILAGQILGQERDQKIKAAYEGGKRAVRAVDLAHLRQLRRELEDGDEGLLAADACLMFDVCQALQLSDGETQHVLGMSYLLVIEAPVLGEVETAVRHTFADMSVCLACGRLLQSGEICPCRGGDDYLE